MADLLRRGRVDQAVARASSVDRYLGGESIGQIARADGVARSTAWRRIISTGVRLDELRQRAGRVCDGCGRRLGAQPRTRGVDQLHFCRRTACRRLEYQVTVAWVQPRATCASCGRRLRFYAQPASNVVRYCSAPRCNAAYLAWRRRVSPEYARHEIQASLASQRGEPLPRLPRGTMRAVRARLAASVEEREGGAT